MIDLFVWVMGLTTSFGAGYVFKTVLNNKVLFEQNKRKAAAKQGAQKRREKALAAVKPNGADSAAGSAAFPLPTNGNVNRRDHA